MTRDHGNSRPAAPAKRGTTGEPAGLPGPGTRMTRDHRGQRHPRARQKDGQDAKPAARGTATRPGRATRSENPHAQFAVDDPTVIAKPPARGRPRGAGAVAWAERGILLLRTATGLACGIALTLAIGRRESSRDGAATCYNCLRCGAGGWGLEKGETRGMRDAYSVSKVRAAEAALMAQVPEGTLMQRAAAGLASVCAGLLRDRAGRRGVRGAGCGSRGDWG